MLCQVIEDSSQGEAEACLGNIRNDNDRGGEKIWGDVSKFARIVKNLTSLPNLRLAICLVILKVSSV